MSAPIEPIEPIEIERVFSATVGGRGVLVALAGQLAIAFDGRHVYPALVCDRALWWTAREGHAEYMKQRRALVGRSDRRPRA